MSSLAAFAVVVAVLAVSLPAAYWQIRRAQRGESTRDRIVREAHERAESAREAEDLERIYSLPVYDPAWEAGLERLWDAVRDHTNTPEGDQK